MEITSRCNLRCPVCLANAGSRMENLTDLPLTSEDDLRCHGSQMACVSLDAMAQLITLQHSGITGNPKRLHCTDADQLPDVLAGFPVQLLAIARMAASLN